MNRKYLIATVSLMLLIVTVIGVFAHDDELSTDTDGATIEVTLDYTPNYYEHVQPIMQTNCISCHIDGEIGHDIFSMETPEEIIASAQDIALVTRIRYMPPWPPSENSPHYLYERTLTQEERAIIAAWAGAGAPAGDPADAIEAEPDVTVPPVEPDLTLQMNAPYVADQSVNDDYRCFMLDPGFEEDTYVTAYDIIPDNTATVHHTILFLATEEQRAEALDKDGADGQAGWSCYGATGLSTGSGVDPERIARLLPILSEVGGASAMRELMSAEDAADQIDALIEANPDGELAGLVNNLGGTRLFLALVNRALNRDGESGGTAGIGTVGSWVPGNQPSHFPEGTGILVEAGGFIVMQMHYYTAGSDEPDQSTVLLETTTNSDTIAIQRQPLFAPVEIPCPTGFNSPDCERAPSPGEGILNSNSLLALCGHSLVEYGTQNGSNATTSCDTTASTTGWAISINSHMHELGKVSQTILRPGQPDEQVLIDIQDWDFDWQGDYWFAEPIWVNEGDALRLICSWDNSESLDNPAPRYVTFGESTNDEMCLTSIAIVSAEPGSPSPVILGAEAQTASDEMSNSHNHNMPLELGSDATIPEVTLSVTSDVLGGYLINLEVQNFTFAPQNVGLDHVDGEGHAHLYVNGEKVARLYGEWFYLNTLPTGENTLTVTLNSNTHAPLHIDGAPISANVVVDVSE